MTQEQPTVERMSDHSTVTDEAGFDAPADSARAAIEQDDGWLEQTAELPPRPRRRLLNPAPLALLGVLLTACGFIGGVLVEKRQTSSSSSSGGGAASLTSRLAALRGGASGTAVRSGTGGGLAGLGTGRGRPVSGQVAYLAGSTLYVTEAEGNTVKVRTSPATSVTKTMNASVKGIHPGETVIVTGATGANGALSAESISVGSGAGGFAALFGRSGRGAGASARGGAAGGEPALFGGG